MNLSPISRFATRNALRIKKNSPQILFYAGIVGTITTTILASRATLKAQPLVEEFKSNRGELDSFHLDGEVKQDDYTREVIRQYTVLSVDLSKLYGPAIVVGIGSLVALTKSHQQLTNRNTALTMAYTGLFKTFEAYRARVREDLGDDRDRTFLHGSVQKEIEYEDKSGKKKTKSITTLDSSSAAALTYYFDANTDTWCKDPGYNQNFLDNTQEWANILLQKKGHMFLNEVYDMLHIPHTREGQILGWVYQDLGNNDMFIDFGHRKDGEFFAGFSRDVMLEFNIHGPILELI